MAEKTKSVNRRNFWERLPRPLLVIAPMANVTDCVFRGLFAKYGKPTVMWTEFVSADGLVSKGGRRLLIDLKYSTRERPIVAQLFTGHPDTMKKASTKVAKLGFDGIDINMGCPDRAVERQGGGSAMMKDPANAIRVIEACRDGVLVAGKNIPVSVKTRIGYNRIEMGWIEKLLEMRLPALTIHLRTRKEMSNIPAHWEVMKDIVKLKNSISPDTLIIGNGDVIDQADALAKIERSGCDGVMIGRGIFGKPWLFENKPRERSPAERLDVMVEHAKAFDKEFCGKKRIKNFAIMRKHFKAYVSGWDGAKELRALLMETEDSKDVVAIVKAYKKLHKNMLI